MTYIILVAGKGVKLHPLTSNTPKSLYRLDGNVNVLQRLVRQIRKNDINAEIVLVVGFMHEYLMKEMFSENVTFVHNPFFSVTSSMGSLWFARKFLQRENVVIINGDIVLSDELIQEVIVKPTDFPFVLVDSSLSIEGKYFVQVQEDKVCVMSKQLMNYYATYCSITKLDAITSRFLLEETEKMINNGMYDCFYEDALVQMIFTNNFELYYKDIKEYAWTEIDKVDDLLKAKLIHNT